MEIREAVTGDIHGIQAVASASWAVDYPDILSRESIERSLEEWYGRNVLDEDIQRSDVPFLVAIEDEEVIGFSHAVWDHDVGTILRLYVHPDHRRQGIGGALFDATAKSLIADGVERLQAMVLAANTPGNEFYRAAGFTLDDEGSTLIAGKNYAENVYVKTVGQ